jgi:hypothetical protein
MNFALQIILVGIGATIAMDCWQLLLRALFNIPLTNWALAGRWFSYIPRGKFVHRTIAESAPVGFEAATGWIAHYVTGIIYAALYLILVSGIPDVGPSFLSALAFGVITVVMPLCVLHPGMGMGLFSRLAQKPNFVRLHTLSNHVVFGSGLYLAYSAVDSI